MLKDEVLARLSHKGEQDHTLGILENEAYEYLLGKRSERLIDEELVKSAQQQIERLRKILGTNQATPRRFRRAFYILAHTRFADWSTMVDAIEEAYKKSDSK